MKVKTKQKIKKIALDVCVVIVAIVLVLGIFKLSTSAAEAVAYGVCNHSWSDSYTCVYCGITCNHGQYDEQGVCITCGFPCAGAFDVGSGHVHSFFGNNGVCKKCGYACKHSNTTTMSVEAIDKEWHNVYRHCNICGVDVVDKQPHTHAPGSCYCNSCKVTYHWYDNGVCTECGKVCSHSFVGDTCTECLYVCTHEGYIDLVGTDNVYHVDGDSKCGFCNSEFGFIEKHIYSDGVCSVCSWVCTHDYVDGTCKHCNMICSHESAETIYVSKGIDGHSYTTRCVNCYYEIYNITASHTYLQGVCEYCDYSCPHDVWSLGSCCNCGYICPHDYIKDFYFIDFLHHNYNYLCTICGIQKEGQDAPSSHSWNDKFICTDCEAICEHQYRGAVCEYCGKVCNHTYNGGRCTTCGWACTRDDGSVGHSYVNDDKSLTGGECRYCHYLCKHTSGYEWRRNYDSRSHYDVSVCKLCGITEVNDNGSEVKGGNIAHTFSSVGSSGCKCTGCDYSRTHSDKDAEFVRCEPYDSFKHRNIYKYSCCGLSYYEDVEHTFVTGSNNDFKCTVCNAYSVTADNMYNIGYNKGLIDGADMDSGSIAEGMIFGVYDGMTNTFFSMLNYEIFGINIANLIISLAAIALVVFVVKKVI